MASFNFLKTDYQLKQLKNKFSTVWYAGKINGYWCTVNFNAKECSITIGAHKDEEHIEFQDRDQERAVFRIFIFEKMNKLDFKNPDRMDILENFYIEKNCDIVYKDDETIIIKLEQDGALAYNIHNFDDTKTELAVIVSIGTDRELSENELFDILKEAKSFIKK